MRNAIIGFILAFMFFIATRVITLETRMDKIEHRSDGPKIEAPDGK